MACGNAEMKKELLELSLEIITLYKTLVFTEKEFIISKMILKAGTDIGAEFCNGQLTNCYNKAVETDFWLEVLLHGIGDILIPESTRKDALFSTMDFIKEKLRLIIVFLEKEI